MSNVHTPNPGLETVIANSIKTATEEPTTEVETADAVDDNAITTEEPAAEETPEVKETPAAEVATEEPVIKVEEPVKKEEPVKDDETDLDKIPARGTDNRVNRIPHPRVVKITENAVKKATAPLQAEIEKSRGTLERIAKVENIMFNDQAKFVEMLKQIPGYAELLAPKVADKVADVEFKMPAPDVKNDKGEAVGYSLGGLQSVVKFAVEQATAQATKETESRLGKRLEPFEAQAKSVKERAAFEASFQKDYDAQMAEANTWPMFKENQDAILAALVKDSEEAKTSGRRPKLTLEGAYQKTVLPKMTADRAKMRAELLAEIAGKPKSTSVVKKEPAAVSKKEAEDAPSDLTAVIKAAVDAAKLSV
jgi:hypothetical protein